MINPGQKTTTIIDINVKLLGVAFFGVLGWWLWSHSSALWWQFYLIGGLCLVGALSCAIRALKLMRDLYVCDKTVKQYRKHGDGRKSSRLASDADLEQGGLL